MKRLINILFVKLFGILRVVFLFFFAYCTTIMTTADYRMSLLIVISGIGICIVVLIRYIYIRNDNRVKDALNTDVVTVIKDNRGDIIGTTKMMFVDFFIGLIALILAIQFLKKI